MKPLYVEFVRDPRWKLVWFVASVFCLVLIGLCAWRIALVRPVIAQQTAQIEALRAQLSKLHTPASTKSDARQTSIDQTTLFLRLDLNHVFATPENLDLLGVRLRNLSVDGVTGTVKLDYEIESLDRVTAVTEALNSGYEKPPWRLENVSVMSPNQAQGVSAGVVPAQQFRGMWSAKVHLL